MSLMTFFPIRRCFSLKLAGALAVTAVIAGSFAAPAFADDDPPALVGRLAVIDGTVSFHTKDETTWTAATPNYPITNGNAIWADANSHAGIQLGANDVNLGSQTELDIDHLDDQTFQASLPQGTVYLNLRALSNGDQIQIATPRGTVNINQPGRYEVFSGDQTHPSTVTVLEGAAQVTGDNNLNLPLSAGQTGVLRDDGQGSPVSATIAQAPAGEDELMAWARSREAQAAPPPPETRQMTGAQDLGRYGTWSTTPDYGNVWYPQVAEDWVPYRSGHWAWVAPWGWTWVDDAPWGFAPFHYGRWVRIGHRWCWAPRPVVVVGAPFVPIYAPALVTFVGDIGGVGVSISLGGPSVGWVPLGPREVYYPPYRVSERYVRNVNVTYVKNVNIINVRNTTVINNNVTVNRFVNHDAVTVVSRDTMTRSQRVSGNMQRVDQRRLDQMHGFNGRQAPLAPTAQTVGLTPTEAKHYGFSADQLQRKSAAGPTVQQNGNRNWSQRTPSANQAGQPNQLQTNNRQQNQLQNTNHQQNNQPDMVGAQQQNRQNNKWTDRGSRKPGSNVVQPGAQQPQVQQLQGNNGQLNNSHGNNNPSNNAQLNNNQVQIHNQNNGGTAQQNTRNQGQPNQDQQKWDWANNKQSRQPGAAVQQQPVQTQQQHLQQVPQENGQAVQNNSKRNQNNQSTETRIIRPQGESKSQGQANQQATDWQARQQKQQYQQNQRYQQQQQERAAQQQQYQAERQQQQRQQQQVQQQQMQQQLIQQQQNQHRQPQGEQVQHTNQSSHQQQQQPQVQQLPQQ